MNLKLGKFSLADISGKAIATKAYTGDQNKTNLVTKLLLAIRAKIIR